MVDLINIEQTEKMGKHGFEVRTKVWIQFIAYESTLVLPYEELSAFVVPALRTGHVKEMKAREVTKVVKQLWNDLEASRG